MRVRFIKNFFDPAINKEVPAGAIGEYLPAKAQWLIENGYGVPADFAGIVRARAVEEEE